jgi:hypothetical protein
MEGVWWWGTLCEGSNWDTCTRKRRVPTRLLQSLPDEFTNKQLSQLYVYLLSALN